VLCGTHTCAETLRGLRTMEVHKFAEKDLFKKK
jgi:hypothetical protein